MYITFQIHKIEVTVLQALDFHLGCPLSIPFLRRALKIAEVKLKTSVL